MGVPCSATSASISLRGSWNGFTRRPPGWTGLAGSSPLVPGGARVDSAVVLVTVFPVWYPRLPIRSLPCPPVRRLIMWSCRLLPGSSNPSPTAAAVLLMLVMQPAVAQQTFVNVTGTVGIDGQDGLGHAVGWCDIDNDGDQDLAFSNQDGSGFWLYRHDGNGTFSDVTSESGLGATSAGKILWAELTGDEHPDLLVSAAGSRLYRNVDGEVFDDITASSGLSGSPEGVFDVDLDGLCDVITDASDQLFWHRNLGGGRFDTPSMIGPVPSSMATVCFDMDLDGDVDIYIGTYGSSPNQLYRNEGDGSFSEVAAAAGIDFPHASHGLTVGDYDNDGWPDLYIGGYSPERCRLFRNEGDGTFSDVTGTSGVTGYPDTRTVSFTDFDRDGRLDIFASHHDFYTYSNVMWHNQGDGTYIDVAVDLGLSGEFVGDYFGVGWADFDGDTAVDLFAAGHIDRYRLFRNTGCPNHALLVDLVGTRSNRSAIGARVTAHAGLNSWTRFVVGPSGQRDGDSLTLEFGLGPATAVDSVVVHWPGGRPQTFGPFTADRRVTLIESDTPTGAPSTRASPVSLEAAPNPFNPRVQVSYRVPRHDAFRLEVFDTRGRLVRTLRAGRADDDQATAIWDGTDRSGRRVASGVYELRLTTSVDTASQRVTLMR
ncbi:hypothetical protein GF314_02345 [bacterium]|nr:hypothetical protein [bacterium]